MYLEGKWPYDKIKGEQMVITSTSWWEGQKCVLLQANASSWTFQSNPLNSKGKYHLSKFNSYTKQHNNKCIQQQLSVERHRSNKTTKKAATKHKVLVACSTATFSNHDVLSRKLGTMQPDQQRSSFWVYGAKRVDLLLEDERPRVGFHHPLLDGPHYVQGSMGSSSLGGTSSS